MNLSEKLVKTLKEKNLTIATAESCTGGLISKKITDISGSAEVFGYGICTYANEAKKKILGVKESTLEEFGAVSSETAYEMASGLSVLSNADIAVSVTGLAGPGGGSEKKPIGLVYFGFSYSGKIETVKKLFAEDAMRTREEIRELSAQFALTRALEIAKDL